jgi:hypothetical protein
MALTTVLGFILAASGASAAAQDMHAMGNSNAAFNQLKSLAGTWVGSKSQGEPVNVTYEVVSNGSAVMERLQPAKEDEMITMYSLEGNRVVVTHYCAMGNQPTMQTEPLSTASGKYDFHFVRVSGTKTADEGHMVGLEVSMPDKNHLTQVWTFADHGKTSTQTFTFTRKT